MFCMCWRATYTYIILYYIILYYIILYYIILYYIIKKIKTKIKICIKLYRKKN